MHVFDIIVYACADCCAAGQSQCCTALQHGMLGGGAGCGLVAGVAGSAVCCQDPAWQRSCAPCRSCLAGCSNVVTCTLHTPCHRLPQHEALDMAHLAPLTSLRHLAIVVRESRMFHPLPKLGVAQAAVLYALKHLTYLEFEGGWLGAAWAAWQGMVWLGLARTGTAPYLDHLCMHGWCAHGGHPAASCCSMCYEDMSMLARDAPPCSVRHQHACPMTCAICHACLDTQNCTAPLQHHHAPQPTCCQPAVPLTVLLILPLQARWRSAARCAWPPWPP